MDASTQLTDQQAAAAAGAGIIGLIMTLIYLAIALFLIVAMWKLFTKAGKPGWAAIVPIYNIIVLLEIVGRPAWWFLLYFIPLVNIVVLIMVMLDLAKSFGKDTGFAVGLILLSIIFLPILAFGDARYVGPAGAPAAPAPYYPPQQPGGYQPPPPPPGPPTA
jgi:hypothetical protein